MYSCLHGYVLRQVGPNDVDDVVSEALTVAWRRWGDRPPTGDRCRAWVFGIAHKKVLELYRARDRDRCVVDAVAAQPPGASAAVDDVVATDRVQRWLGELPVHERASVYLVAICGFTLAEVGMILGHPTSTISARVTRALRRMRPLADTEMASGDTEMALVNTQMEGSGRGLGR
ncbi:MULTISPECIES: RNA polymerase sigma factor [Xylanimonas]|uniref:RNA polymerase sigma factor n=1 Tax=Xylanimonas TaxID=186188 RepID=UPI0013A61AC1|nr:MULTISPECIES: sigma-70 family RNA polymerase sigma factor [Xylanimonas]